VIGWQRIAAARRCAPRDEGGEDVAKGRDMQKEKKKPKQKPKPK
jgi:hypothetical protein